MNRKVGRVTPCASQPNIAETARRGLTRTTALRSWSASLASAVIITTASLLLLRPAVAHAQGGVPLWTNRFDSNSPGGPSVTVDGSGNVFATGYRWNGSGNDCATVKYSSTGVPLWTNYIPVPNGYNVGSAVDTMGNVFVTGSFGTVKYSSAGVPLWTNYGWSTGLIALDNNGNVFVSSYFDPTTAFSNSGVPLWTNRYRGPTGSDGAFAITADSVGNVILAGSSQVEARPGYYATDYATVKYSNSGVPLWTNRFDGPANESDVAVDIAVDSTGNAFVTGSSRAANGFPDYATIKYSSTGVPLWTNRYNAANDSDEATTIAVDSAGNVFVTGYSYNGSSTDYATLKYSNAGMLLWTRRYNGPGNDWDGAYAIAVDSAGNVFVAGQSSAVNGSSDFAVVTYSNAGVPLWTRRYNGIGNGDDAAYAIAVDCSGNVIVAGSSWNGTNYDWVTIKYSSSVPPPRLDFQKQNNELVLSWTNAGFNLQTAPAVTGPFTNLRAATSPYTNLFTTPQQFFRLIGN